MRGEFVYYAQSRDRPCDPFYAKVFTSFFDLHEGIAGFEPAYIVFRYSPEGDCKVIDMDNPWSS
jgi:hypothetical protein